MIFNLYFLSGFGIFIILLLTKKLVKVKGVLTDVGVLTPTVREGIKNKDKKRLTIIN